LHILPTRCLITCIIIKVKLNSTKSQTSLLIISRYVMWDPDPHNWVPINHSCDPNVWVTGLNMTARRPILFGESITFDYATMYTSNPVNFKCLCGTSLCRGMWQGNDYLQQWFKERYGTHVTDFVQHEQKRHPNITSDSSQERSL